MKLLYAAFVRLPTEKAHGVQIVRTCEALAEQGADVELVIPNRTTSITQDTYAYYGVKHNFDITPLPVLDFIGLGRIGFLLSAILFAHRVARHAKLQKLDVIYSRDRMVVLFLAYLTRVKLVWEIHGKEPVRIVKRLASRVRIVAITKGIRDELIVQGVAPKCICIAPDGVDLAPFERMESKEDARRRLGLSLDKKIAMYIGRLDGWKGSGTLLEASTLLPANIQVVIIGGEAAQVEELRRRYAHILFLGFLPYRNIANNEAAADVLVLPNTSHDVTSLRYTSPLKLFAYMASGKPIVASDLPSIHEVLSEHEAFFVESDNAQALADGIVQALTASDAPARAVAARAKVTEYTWDKRAERILACTV